MAEKFLLRGYCPHCNQVFVDETSTWNHKQNSGHKVRLINSMEESILLYCHSSEGNKPPSDLHLLQDESKFSSLKRNMSSQESSSQDCSTVPKKKMNLGVKSLGGVVCFQKERSLVKTWFCECHQRFPSEDAVEKHVFSANTMCYKCVVCCSYWNDCLLLAHFYFHWHSCSPLRSPHGNFLSGFKEESTVLPFASPSM